MRWPASSTAGSAARLRRAMASIHGVREPKVPVNYDDLRASCREAAGRYADALEANGYSAPAGLQAAIAQA